MTAIRVTTCAALVFLGVITTVRSAIAQTPGRDAAKAVQTGTAGIEGIVVSDDAGARPLRRVRVAVVTSDRQVARTVVTDGKSCDTPFSIAASSATVPPPG